MRRGRMATALALAAGYLLVTTPLSAFPHIARSGETLKSLARRYYGDPNREAVIRAANGFVHPDDGSLTEGERIEIPRVSFHRVQLKETWDGLAEKYLASPKRGAFLAELNKQDPSVPPTEGLIIKIPYHIRHIFAADESLKSITRQYYGKDQSPTWLRRYNFTRKWKFPRGSVLIVPLFDLALTSAEQERLADEQKNLYSEADAQAQKKAVQGILLLKELFERGRYVEMVAVGGRLAGGGGLTVPQQIGVHRYMAYAYVALDENALAVEEFLAALELQPEMELSPITTSPKILSAYRQARQKVKKPLETKQDKDKNKIEPEGEDSQ